MLRYFINKATALAVALSLGRIGLLAGWAVVGLLACSAEQPIDTLHPVSTVSFTKKNDFYPSRASYTAYYWDSVKNKNYYYFLNKNENKLYYVQTNLYSDSILLNQVDLRHLFNHTNYSIESMGIINPDSLVFVDGEMQNMCLTDGQGKIRQYWQPRASIYGRTEYSIDTYSQPIYCKNNLLYLLSSPSIGAIIADSSLFHQYLSYKFGLILNVRDTTFAASYGNFPSILSAKNNFNIIGPVTCVSPKGHYLFSFGPFEEIYDYSSDGTCRVVKAPSRYHRPAQGQPFSAFLNRQALTDYKLRQPEYTRLLHDPYRHRYLRVYMHGMAIDSTAILRPAYADMPWSLLILDENLKRTGEVDFSPDFDPRNILVTHQGVLVGNNRPERPHYKPNLLSYKLFTYKVVASK